MTVCVVCLILAANAIIQIKMVFAIVAKINPKKKQPVPISDI